VYFIFIVELRMAVVSLDSRGRITIPKEIRSKLKSKKFLVVLDGKNI